MLAGVKRHLKYWNENEINKKSKGLSRYTVLSCAETRPDDTGNRTIKKVSIRVIYCGHKTNGRKEKKRDRYVTPERFRLETDRTEANGRGSLSLNPVPDLVCFLPGIKLVSSRNSALFYYAAVLHSYFGYSLDKKDV